MKMTIKVKKNKKNITESITMVRFRLILQSSDKLKVLGPYGDPMLSMRYSGGQKWPKMRQKTLNDFKMWKIFCTEVVVVVFFVVVDAVVIVVDVLDSGFDRKRK